MLQPSSFDPSSFLIIVEPRLSTVHDLLPRCSKPAHDLCFVLLVDPFPGYGITQSEPRSVVQKLPLKVLLDAIPSRLRITNCSFSDSLAARAILSSQSRIQRCEQLQYAESMTTGKMPSLGNEVEESLKLHGFAGPWREGAAGVFVQERQGALNRLATLTQDPELPLEPTVLQLPDGVTDAIIDIGLADSTYSPPEGRKTTTVAIVVEASLKEVQQNRLIQRCHQRQTGCIFVHGAVTNLQKLGKLVQFWQTTRSGGNALDLPSMTSRWPMELGSSLVPMMTFKILLDSISPEIGLFWCKTDTNGNDHRVLRSAGPGLKRCKVVEAEFILDGSSGPLCQEESAVEHMQSIGYKMKVTGADSTAQIPGTQTVVPLALHDVIFVPNEAAFEQKERPVQLWTG